MYSVVGYDKDNDVFVEYGTDKKYDEAVSNATHLSELMEKGELMRDNGEPIDWIEIYRNYNKLNEELVWASYEQRTKRFNRLEQISLRKTTMRYHNGKSKEEKYAI